MASSDLTGDSPPALHLLRSPHPVVLPGLSGVREEARRGRWSPASLEGLFRACHPRSFLLAGTLAFLSLVLPAFFPQTLPLALTCLLLGPVLLFGAVTDSLFADSRPRGSFLPRWLPVALRSLLFLPVLSLLASLILLPVLQGLAGLSLVLDGALTPSAALALAGLGTLGAAGYLVWLRASFSLTLPGEGVFVACRQGLTHPLRDQHGNWIRLTLGTGLPEAATMLAVALAGTACFPFLMSLARTPTQVLGLLTTRAAVAFLLTRLILRLAFAWMVEVGGEAGGEASPPRLLVH